MKTCPDCGERVYKLGCVNCNEAAYIAEQEDFDRQHAAEEDRDKRLKYEQPTWGGYPLTWGDEG